MAQPTRILALASLPSTRAAAIRELESAYVAGGYTRAGGAKRLGISVSTWARLLARLDPALPDRVRKASGLRVYPHAPRAKRKSSELRRKSTKVE